jgi:hypothetical protein
LHGGRRHCKLPFSPFRAAPLSRRLFHLSAPLRCRVAISLYGVQRNCELSLTKGEQAFGACASDCRDVLCLID